MSVMRVEWCFLVLYIAEIKLKMLISILITLIQCKYNYGGISAARIATQSLRVTDVNKALDLVMSVHRY